MGKLGFKDYVGWDYLQFPLSMPRFTCGYHIQCDSAPEHTSQLWGMDNFQNPVTLAISNGTQQVSLVSGRFSSEAKFSEEE